MKNSARKSGSGTNKSRQSGKTQSKAAKDNTAFRKPDKERDVLYQVTTPRTADILKAYITFTYRVFHPAVTARLVLYGIIVAAPGFLIKIQGLKIALWIIGGLMILLGLFRQYISLAITRRNDPDYRSGAVFTYEFTAEDASFYRNGELFSSIRRYKDIYDFFYDENYYYLSISNRDFFILPKSKFTIGDAKTFEDFIYRKSRKTCRWIPNKYSDQIKKRRAARAVASGRK